MLDTLLELQTRDTTVDRLTHRRDTLPERAALESVRSELTAAGAQLAEVTAQREEVAREEQRFDDEARSLEDKAAEVERRMYSGEVTSPRELQALQADVDQLRRHRRGLEDRELEVMERREAIDAEVETLRARVDELESEAERLGAALGEVEGEIDEELGGERAARDEIAATLAATLLDDYHRCREPAPAMAPPALHAHTSHDS